MRTTLTIDDDVAAVLKKMRKDRDQPFKQLINETLRKGLSVSRPPSKSRKPFQTSEVALGRCRLPGVDNVAEALAIAEGEPFK